MSPLAECILKAGGDIIKYAGDAILAVWRVYDNRFINEILRVVDCALYIQETYGSFFCADVDITIRGKLTPLCLLCVNSNVGLNKCGLPSKNWDWSWDSL